MRGGIGYGSSFPAVALMTALFSGTAAIAAEDDVQTWLDRMTQAVETLNYRGTLVHIRDGAVDTMRIVHRADEDGVHERIYSIDGEPREVLRDGSRVRCLLPGDQPQVLESHFTGRLLPSMPIDRLTQPESAYRMSMGGRDRVAGMMTRVVLIEPRDEFRYGYRLWLEEETGMLLRYALIDRDGSQLQQLSFAEIEIGVPISDLELAPGISDAGRVLTTRLENADDQAPAGQKYAAIESKVPAGFRLANVGHGHGEGGSAFDHLLFSDGLASFSVYIEKASADAVGSRMESIGPVHVYTSQAGGRLFTIVGEVPASTVEAVGREFRSDQFQTLPSQ